MVEEDKLLYIAVIIALIGTSSLYLYSATQGATTIDISEIGSEDTGALIRTEGVISKVESYSDTYCITLKEKGNNSTIDVYASSKVISKMKNKSEIRTGAHLWIKGKVESYQNEINLRVTGPGEIIIKKKAYSSFTPIESILQNPEWYQGMNLKVRGRIESLEMVGNSTYMEISPLEEEYCLLGAYIQDWDYSENRS